MLSLYQHHYKILWSQRWFRRGVWGDEGDSESSESSEDSEDWENNLLSPDSSTPLQKKISLGVDKPE